MNLYLAYGSNLNLQQMAQRCPDSKPFAKSVLKDVEMVFRGEPTQVYATLQPKKGCEVPVLLWDITTQEDKDSLDVYEGYPRLYHIDEIAIEVNNEIRTAFMYIMNPEFLPGMPSDEYVESIVQGYVDNGFDIQLFENYLQEHKRKMQLDQAL